MNALSPTENIKSTFDFNSNHNYYVTSYPFLEYDKAPWTDSSEADPIHLSSVEARLKEKGVFALRICILFLQLCSILN